MEPHIPLIPINDHTDFFLDSLTLPNATSNLIAFHSLFNDWSLNTGNNSVVVDSYTTTIKSKWKRFFIVLIYLFKLYYSERIDVNVTKT